MASDALATTITATAVVVRLPLDARLGLPHEDKTVCPKAASREGTV